MRPEFKAELNKINTKDIRDNLKAYFPDDIEAARIAVVVDKLIGKMLSDTDARTRKISKDIHFHFDDPDGRIVKMEKMLVALCKERGIELDDDKSDEDSR